MGKDDPRGTCGVTWWTDGVKMEFTDNVEVEGGVFRWFVGDGEGSRGRGEARVRG